MRREGHRDALRRDHELAVVDPVRDDAGDEAEDREGDEAAERERADRQRRVGQLDHEPGERDVLHPGAADRDHLAGEEEPVVAVPAEARERARVEREQRRRHRSLPSGSIAASIAASSSSSSPRRRSASQVVRRARTRLSSRSPSSVSVRPTRRRSSVVAHALDQACLLEPVDVAGERGRRDPLLGGQLAQAQARDCRGSARAA